MDEKSTSLPKYLPGFEPKELKSLVNSFFSVINESFPDKVIVRSEWNHQWDNAANYLCRTLGYSSGKDFLESYGFCIIDDKSSAKPNGANIQDFINSVDTKTVEEKHDVHSSQEKHAYPDTEKKGIKKTVLALSGIGVIIIILFFSLTDACYVCGKRPAKRDWIGYSVCDDCFNRMSESIHNKEEAEENAKSKGYSDLVFRGFGVQSNSVSTYCEGSIYNTGSQTYKYIEVKAIFKNASGKVLDTDWTYACGAEGLAPGESSKVKIYVDKDNNIKSVEVQLLDFDIA